MSRTRVKRSTPTQRRFGDQTDRTALEDHDGDAVRALVDQRRRVGHRIVGRQHHRGVDDQVAALDEVDRLLTAVIGRSCGRTTMPPRRAIVSAIRRPATAVMLATTTGMVVPEPSCGGQVDVEA